MLWLLLLQVLASCLWLGHSEVVTSFADCQQFFYDGTYPNDVLHPKKPAWICQSYSNSYHYATLYDRDRKIPVYSAYIYQPGSGKRPHTWSFVEPQLTGEKSPNDMEREWVLIDQDHFTLDQIKESQAILDDYEKMTNLDRGQLNPSGHQDTTNNKTATFTLTNTVPMYSSLYTGQWNTYESETMAKFTEGCTSTYVITGAVPGNTYINNRVNVPSHIWSAACCQTNTIMKTWAVIADNTMNQVQNYTLEDLEETLSQHYKGKVSLFNRACPRT